MSQFIQSGLRKKGMSGNNNLAAGNARSCAPVEVQIEPLAAHSEALPMLRRWFEAEWPDYYGADCPGVARRDLEAFANRGCLPVGVVAFRGGQVCAVAALKAESFVSHGHLSPWAAAGLVRSSERGRGIGTQLLAALEREACRLGLQRVYCGTNTAESLLRHLGWQLMKRIVHEGQVLGIYCKVL
jgi:GNAT superfamily N-acetyltransferase